MSRRQNWSSILGVSLLAIAAAGACKPGNAGAETSTDPSPNAVNVSSVLLLADMAEAEDSCGCGDIIRSVREAATKGVRTREVDARNRDEAGMVVQKYQVTVQPAVLLLDNADREVRRFEGESNDTIQALETELARLAPRK